MRRMAAIQVQLDLLRGKGDAKSLAEVQGLKAEMDRLWEKVK